MNYNWQWEILFQAPYLEWILTGLLWTIIVSLVAWFIALSLGVLVGVGRTLPNKVVRLIATAYVELFRNIPLLVQMFVWYFVIPEIVPDDLGRWLKRDLPYPEHATAIVALGLYTASRIAEQVRAGIESVPQGLSRAALANGMNTPQVYRFILFPISFRLIVPPMTSEFLTIFKNSSLALTIGVLELTAQSQQISEYTFQGFEAFTAATVIYVFIALVVTVFMHLLEARLTIPGLIGKKES